MTKSLPPSGTSITKFVSHVVGARRQHLEQRVRRLRTRHTGESDAELAKRIVRCYANRCATVGALSSVGGLITLPVAVPANLAASWVLQIEMVYSIACIYGCALDEESITLDFLLVAFGDSVREGLKRAGVTSINTATKRAVQQHITRDVMVRINRVVPRTVLTKAGQKSLTSFTKMVPAVGAAAWYMLDHRWCTFVGKRAMAYYCDVALPDVRVDAHLRAA